MLKNLMALARPALFTLEPERAHALVLKALKAGFHPRQNTPDDPRLGQNLLDLDFPNPLGMAAGFDKNGEVPDALHDMGFGFVEVGTVTPRPQSGNPPPRVFRLIEDHALINRLGFNNAGHAALRTRLLARQHRCGQAHHRRHVVGVNLGANKTSKNKIADYVKGLEVFYGLADYVTINISSPNTPGLRDLQTPEALDELLHHLMTTRQNLMAAEDGKHVAPSLPVLVKLAPDIEPQKLEAVTERLTAHQIDGIIISNTTLSRGHLRTATAATQEGGLSGRPLFERSTAMLGRVYQLTGGRIPLVGVGGIDSPETAFAKIEAGASLLQLYTGLVYNGPALVAELKAGLLNLMTQEGLTTLRQATGRHATMWARRWEELCRGG